ncbi:MAG TPA: DUF4258 domain-containing protein [Anaerolineae bacterium]|nr:DUF4258 domain-containing protein [Anaerolineae bacterium]HMR67211.1 DUF4258 domain-containing protein [Anaerolineae bacterium]
MSQGKYLSKHAVEMLQERNIAEDWVWQTVNSPDDLIAGADGNVHYIKSIAENQGRVLRVIVNPSVDPNRVVTVFFDRRLRRKK